jgi:ribosomal protein S18 acetylase RimI-like enzyme
MIVDSIEIQKVNSDYILQLQKIGRQTFYETFSEENSAEDMLNYLEEGFSIDKLRKELNDINSEFYFAKRNDDIIGYLKLNFGQSQTEIKEDNALEIERIYVLKDFQGKGIGQLLYNKAKLIASEKNVNYIWLGVWEKNMSAINFYIKNGFIEFDKHVFKLGNDEQIDLMMKLNLKN